MALVEPHGVVSVAGGVEQVLVERLMAHDLHRLAAFGHVLALVEDEKLLAGGIPEADGAGIVFAGGVLGIGVVVGLIREHADRGVAELALRRHVAAVCGLHGHHVARGVLEERAALRGGKVRLEDVARHLHGGPLALGDNAAGGGLRLVHNHAGEELLHEALGVPLLRLLGE